LFFIAFIPTFSGYTSHPTAPLFDLPHRAFTITPKSDGAGLMISAFCSPHFGWLAYSDEAWKQALLQHPEWAAQEEQHRNAYEVFEYGARKKRILDGGALHSPDRPQH